MSKYHYIIHGRNEGYPENPPEEYKGEIEATTPSEATKKAFEKELWPLYNDPDTVVESPKEEQLDRMSIREIENEIIYSSDGEHVFQIALKLMKAR